MECRNPNVQNPNNAESQTINRSNRYSSDFGHSNKNIVRILALYYKMIPKCPKSECPNCVVWILDIIALEQKLLPNQSDLSEIRTRSDFGITLYYSGFHTNATLECILGLMLDHEIPD